MHRNIPIDVNSASYKFFFTILFIYAKNLFVVVVRVVLIILKFDHGYFNTSISYGLSGS